jgi:lysyl endopeptidase
MAPSPTRQDLAGGTGVLHRASSCGTALRALRRPAGLAVARRDRTACIRRCRGNVDCAAASPTRCTLSRQEPSMRHSLLALSLLAALGSAPALAMQVGGEPARSLPPDPSTLALAALPPGKAAAPRQRWAPLEAAAVAALQARNAGSHKAMQVGIERGLGEREGTAADWAWSTRADGVRVARLRVQSPDAAALRVALDLHGLPDGAELRFAAEGEAQSVVAPVSGAAIAAQQRVQPLYWGPVTDGDTQLIELRLPAGSDTRFLRLEVAALSHLLLSPYGDWDPAKVGESGACNVDVRCESAPPAAFTNAKNAVARMIYQEGGSFVCTGTLLNDTDSSTQVPYLFSAAHCFTSQSTANTLTTFWFYEATACRSNILDTAAARQVSGGASVLVGDRASDVLFLRLNNAPPAGSFFNGWDSSLVNSNTDALFIHHPRGDVKKRSLGRITGLGGSSLASGSFIKAGYTSGTTEGGSSGCGLLTSNGSEFLLRGGLLGGGASCANAGNTPGSGGNSDDYSRFDLAFPSLRSFLAPPSSNPPPAGTDFTGAWSNPAQDGWGLVVIRGSSGGYAMYIYHYDQDSSPGWYLSAGALNGTRYSADLFAFTGPWFGITPFNPGQVGSRDAGGLSVDFTGVNTATISFTIDGRTVSTTLNRLAF